jgi:hypothetical protein
VAATTVSEYGNLNASSVKICEAVEFASKAAVRWRCDLPENVIWGADFLQIRFVILSAAR